MRCMDECRAVRGRVFLEKKLALHKKRTKRKDRDHDWEQTKNRMEMALKKGGKRLFKALPSDEFDKKLGGGLRQNDYEGILFKAETSDLLLRHRLQNSELMHDVKSALNRRCRSLRKAHADTAAYQKSHVPVRAVFLNLVRGIKAAHPVDAYVVEKKLPGIVDANCHDRELFAPLSTVFASESVNSAMNDALR